MTTTALIQRELFPMLSRQVQGHPLVYLDSAATALTPQPVIDALCRYYAQEYGTVHRAVYTLAMEATERYNQVRQQVARFLNATSEEEIIFTRGTTESINLIAHSFGDRFVNMGDEILVSNLAHHANIVPWQLMCEARGANLRVLPVNDRGELILDALEECLCGRTKLIALSHISNAIGTHNPIEEIVTMAHRYGAYVLVDGAQAVPHLSVDVQALDVDFYAFSGHKLYGPTGIGVLYGKRSLLEQLPPYQGGGDMIEKVTFEETTYNTIPNRFEAGTPHIAGVMGLSAAIDYVQEIGLETIHAHEMQLMEKAQALQEIEGLRVIGTAEKKSPIVSFTIEGVHPLDIATLLDLQGICVRSGHHCSQPTMARFGVTATTRLSFGLYNTLEEVEYFIAALKGVVAKLRK